MKKLLAIVCTLSSVLLFGCNNGNVTENVVVEEPIVIDENEIAIEKFSYIMIPETNNDYDFAKNVLYVFQKVVKENVVNGSVSIYTLNEGDLLGGTIKADEITLSVSITSYNINQIAKQNTQESRLELEILTRAYHKAITEKLEEKLGRNDFTLNVRLWDGDFKEYTSYYVHGDYANYRVFE